MSIEEEYTFNVEGDVASQTLRLKKLNNYDLTHESIVKLNDVYMDTDDGFLREKKSVLRVRFINDLKFITYKRKISDTENEEMETKYTLKKFQKIRKSLDVLNKSLGCFHERIVYRDINKVKINGIHICDLCIDLVTFGITDEKDRVNSKRDSVWFYQIEIENKSKSRHHDDFINFVKLLKKKFRLEEWKSSKTETCIRIQKLYKTNKKFRKLISNNGYFGYNGFKLLNDPTL